MNSSLQTQNNFLRTSREFPSNLENLTLELDKSYVDIANAVNVRTIGVFPINRPTVTGESFFLVSNQRQQSLRQVFKIGAIAPGATLTTPYSINGFSQFSRIYGTCITNVPDNRPIPYASVTANANIELRVTSTNIIVSVGAASPAITSGIIVLEWISPA